MYVCVYVCVCACVHVCVHMCACVDVGEYSKFADIRAKQDNKKMFQDCQRFVKDLQVLKAERDGLVASQESSAQQSNPSSIHQHTQTNSLADDPGSGGGAQDASTPALAQVAQHHTGPAEVRVDDMQRMLHAYEDLQARMAGILALRQPGSSSSLSKGLEELVEELEVCVSSEQELMQRLDALQMSHAYLEQDRSQLMQEQQALTDSMQQMQRDTQEMQHMEVLCSSCALFSSFPINSCMYCLLRALCCMMCGVWCVVCGMWYVVSVGLRMV